jgi:hypothetical protein
MTQWIADKEKRLAKHVRPGLRCDTLHRLTKPSPDPPTAAKMADSPFEAGHPF